MVYNFKAEIIEDNEINQFIGIVSGLPGVHSQVATLDKLYINLQELICVCLEEMTNGEKSALQKFINTQNISVEL